MKKLITMVLLVTAMAITGCGGDKKAPAPAPKAGTETPKPPEGGATPPADTPAK